MSCPISFDEYPHVLLAHGGGGKLMHRLIQEMFMSVFDNEFLRQQTDSAILPKMDSSIAFTTDSYVVSPLFFPGGDIGKLAVDGTVNDLAMVGATPRFLSLSFVLEEGLPMENLWKVVRSIGDAAQNAGVQIVTGDTKVVERGKADGLYINTSGVGKLEYRNDIGPESIREGDGILLSGDIGRHGMCIITQREGLEFQSSIESDCAALWPLVRVLLEEKIRVHCMRDLTRGGLASAAVEIAHSSGCQLELSESAIPVSEQVRVVCELMGFDPLHVANEGCCVIFVHSEDVERATELLHSHPLGQRASHIGNVSVKENPKVILRNLIGTTRIIDMMSGEQLPRIC